MGQSDFTSDWYAENKGVIERRRRAEDGGRMEFGGNEAAGAPKTLGRYGREGCVDRAELACRCWRARVTAQSSSLRLAGQRYEVMDEVQVANIFEDRAVRTGCTD